MAMFLDSDGRGACAARPGRLLPARPETEGSDCYVYDPADPVRTQWREREMYTGPRDLRERENRPDVLAYLSAPLEEDLEVAGQPEVVLFAASSAPDTDFFVHLADDDPTGAAMEVASGMVRARYRNGEDRDERLTACETAEFRIALGQTACRFRRGHRIRLEITSSDFPNYDRNHNTGGNDLFEPGMVPAEQNVLHGPDAASRLVLPVVRDACGEV